MAALSAGNPFEDRGTSVLFTAFDDSPAGFTDMRRTVKPDFIAVPHRVTVWPEGTPAHAARAASYGR
jgi:hypothetical protein